MAATIKANKDKATVSEGRWACGNASLLRLLESWREDDYPSAGSADIGLAEAAVKRFKAMGMQAELVAVDEPEGEEGRVY